MKTYVFSFDDDTIHVCADQNCTVWSIEFYFPQMDAWAHSSELYAMFRNSRVRMDELYQAIADHNWSYDSHKQEHDFLGDR